MIILRFYLIYSFAAFKKIYTRLYFSIHDLFNELTCIKSLNNFPVFFFFLINFQKKILVFKTILNKHEMHKMSYDIHLSRKLHLRLIESWQYDGRFICNAYCTTYQKDLNQEFKWTSSPFKAFHAVLNTYFQSLNSFSEMCQGTLIG